MAAYLWMLHRLIINGWQNKKLYAVGIGANVLKRLPPPGLPLISGAGVDEGDGGVKRQCLYKRP